MPRILSIVIAGLAVVMMGADDVLKEKGLKKSGTTYVLAGEAEVQKTLNAARLVARQMNNALARQQAYARQGVENKQMIGELTQQRIMLNRQLGQGLPAVQHNQLVAAVNEVTDRLNLLNRQEAEPADRRQVDAQAAQHREAYVQAIIDLRTLVDATTKQYAALADDAEVAAALKAAKGTLGPSKAFAANVKLLERAESLVLTETVDLRKEGGIFWLDVTFNGKVTKPMAFDTGAADVVLPAEFAASIGLNPGPNDPTVRCQVADGSIVEAKRMTVPSMRVGKFTIKDVSCTVMPADKKDVPPLLGQTFQKNFMFKFSPDSGKLVLSRVESPDAPAAPVKPKPTTRKKATKAKGASGDDAG